MVETSLDRLSVWERSVKSGVEEDGGGGGSSCCVCA